MKLKSCFRTAVVLTSLLIHPEINAQVIFEKTYPTTYDKTSRDIVETSGGYLIAGMANNAVLADCDLMVMKTNSNGEHLWTKTYGGNKPDYAYDIQETNDGNYFVLGYTQSFGGGDYDVYLIKINPAGDLIWEKTYIGWGNEEGREIIKTTDGNYVIVGTTNSNISSQDAFLMKIDNDGTVIWIKYYGGNDKEYGNSVKQCTDGGFIIAGQTLSFGQGGDAYVVRTNAAGDEIWTKNFGGAMDDECVSVVANGDGSYVVAVRDSSGGNDIDVRVVKMDNDGDIVWNKAYWGNMKDTPKTIVGTNDGGYLVGAISRSFGWINPDMWILKLNAAGDTTWSRHFGGGDHEHCHAAKQDSEGNFLLIGHARSFGPGQRVYFIKMADGPVSVPEETLFSASTNVFPVPTRDYVNIQTGKPGECEYQLTNTVGEILQTGSFLVENPDEVITLDMKNYATGLYFISIRYKNALVTRHVLVE